MDERTVDVLARRAADAQSNINAYAAVIALLEGGLIYGGRDRPADRIINICKKAMQSELCHFDRAMAALARIGGA